MERPLISHEHSLSSISNLLDLERSPTEAMISGITHSSKEVEQGDMFLAFPGAKTHGANFLVQAFERGARAVLTDAAGMQIAREIAPKLPVLVVLNPRRAAGVLSAWFYGEPMRDMFSVGVTGTNGKTTTTTLLYQIWMFAGRESGLIGTVETRIGTELLKSQRTTPESSDLQALVATMRERHIRNLAMEVSSHAISLDRIRGSHFNVVAFTNLSQDHLDFHSTMDEYFRVKAELFTYEYADLAIINIDDDHGALLAEGLEIPLLTLSRAKANADWRYERVFSHSLGNDVAMRGPGGILIEGLLPLHGDYNLDNALMAVALAVESGVDPVEIAAILPLLSPAQGRLEAVGVGQDFAAFVDYAHSPDAVARVLETCRGMTSGRVIAVLGCGGDRDSSKRPLMGAALAKGSDVGVFTSDNPRSEDPLSILDQMTSGMSLVLPDCVIADRKSAIEYAVAQAHSGDLVVILGKGHETGQEVAGVVMPFDDRLVLAQAIEGRR